MKIKIALFGLLFANSIIYPAYADQYGCQLEEGEATSEDLIKLGTTVTMGPAIIIQNKEWSTKNSLGAQLTFKADVPKAWCDKDATVKIGAGWDGKKDFTIKNAAVTIGKMVTMGYTPSIFGYEKADSASLISVDATVLQVKYEYASDCFRMGYAIERPIALQVGLFHKNKPESKEKDDKDRTNKLDNSKDEKPFFKVKNSFPAFGLSIGAVTDHLNIALSGVGRFTDYTHSTDSKEKNLKPTHYFTCGGNLGIQYQVVPKKFTATGQGIYVHGLGDYVSGLAAVQKDEAREEMCAAYYTDKEKGQLSPINAWGLGATLEYCVTPKWTFSVRGSYLTATTEKDSPKPAQAFSAQWNLVPKIAYEVNKYFTLSGGYSLVEEFRIEKKENKGMEHKFSGSIKFSL